MSNAGPSVSQQSNTFPLMIDSNGNTSSATGPAPIIQYVNNQPVVNGTPVSMGGGAPYLGPVATRTFELDSFTSANKQGESRTRHRAIEDLVAIKIGWPAYYVNASFVETGTGSNPTIASSVEYPANTLTQQTFAGTAIGTATDGSILDSDWTAVSIPAGSYFFAKSSWRSTTGIVYVNYNINAANGETYYVAASGTADNTMSNTVLDNTGGSVGYGPAYILGMTKRGTVAIIGTSRSQGEGNPGDTFDATGDIGETARPVGQFNAYINISRGSDSLVKFLASNTNRLKKAKFCSFALCEHAINDFTNGQTVNQMLANAASLASQLPGIPLYWTTVSPYANGANSGPNNTTTETRRVDWNNRLRAGTVPGMSGYFDNASITQSATNPALWKAGYSTDFLHAIQAGAIAVRDSGLYTATSFKR